MNKRLLSVVGLGALCFAASAAAAQPVAVSPGSTAGIAHVPDPCPTFSWSAVTGASGYELVVLAADEAPVETPVATPAETPAERATFSSAGPPALAVEIRGAAIAWTPSAEQCLAAGRRYAWSVRAITGEGAGPWAEAQLFEVGAGRAADLEFLVEQVLERLLAARGLSAASAAAPGELAERGVSEAEDPEVAATDGATAAVPSAPATVSLTTDGALGVGVASPLADLHVLGGTTVGGMLLAPNVPVGGGSSEILLAEDDDGTFGMKVRYEGSLSSDTLEFWGHKNGLDVGPWLTLARDTGATTFAGAVNVIGPTLDVDGTLRMDGTVTKAGTGLVTNFNADLLDNQHASAFAGQDHHHKGQTWTTGGDGLTVETTGTNLEFGLKGVATDTGTSATTGVIGKASSTNGIGIFGWSTSLTHGIGVKAYSQGTAYPAAAVVNDYGPLLWASSSNSLVADLKFSVANSGDIWSAGDLVIEGVVAGDGAEPTTLTSSCGTFVAVALCPVGAVDGTGCDIVAPGAYCEYDTASGCTNLDTDLDNCGDYDWYFRAS